MTRQYVCYQRELFVIINCGSYFKITDEHNFVEIYTSFREAYNELITAYPIFDK